MIMDAPGNLYHRRRTYPSSKLYWLNIELNINSIFFRQRAIKNNILINPQLFTLQYCVLHGIGAVENVLTVGEKGIDLIISWSMSLRSCTTKKTILKHVRPPG
jgi:hypothetical protein